MKKIVNEKEFKNKLVDAINILSDLVIKTLGPKGENVLINNSECMPFITNDGVTIAKNITSEDEVINSIITILKEASLKTDEEVGDGTTTTIVLLKSLIINGLEKIKMGEKASNLKKDLESKLNEILELLDKEIRKPTVKNYYEIASTSANDEEVGKIITEYFLKVKDKSAIKIKESNSFKTYIEKINGYYFDGSLSSKMFLMNQNEVVLKDCYVLLIDGYVDDQYMITNIYNMMIEKQSNLIILADSFSDEMISSTLEINLANDFKIILINSIDYVEKKKEILEDLEIITNAKIVKDDVISVEDLGFSKEVKCEIDKVTITANKSKSLSKHINKLTKLAKEIKEDYYLEDLKERINKLKNKMIFIYVGGYTKTEKKELMMRYEDALCSLNVSQQGILIGGGLTLLKISDFIDDAMIKEVLESPIKQIMDNSNLDYEELIKNIRKNNYQMIYNVKDNHYENIDKTKVLDSYLVVKKALETSFSIAIMMLTTSFLVINLNNEAKTIEI